MSIETKEILEICEQLPAEKREAVASFARSLLGKNGDPKPKKHVDFRSLIGIGLEGPTNPNPRFPDNDSLWEGSAGEDLKNAPRKKK